MKFIDLAFNSLSAAASQNNDLFLAINDLVQKTTDSLMTFGTSIGWLEQNPTASEPAKKKNKAKTQPRSVVQPQGANDAAKDSKSKRLLMAGINIVTALISAFEEEPPDFESAFATIKLEGWKVVKTLTPSKRQDTETFKNVEKAWKLAFTEANGVTEKYMEGDIARSVLHAIDTAFQSVEHVADPSLQKLLESIRKLVHDIGEAGVEFADRLG